MIVCRVFKREKESGNKYLEGHVLRVVVVIAERYQEVRRLFVLFVFACLVLFPHTKDQTEITTW